MPDLRDDLDRLADRAGEPASFNDLASARRRRERRRRAEGLVVGLAVIVAAAVFLATTFRSSPTADVPGATPPATAYAPPETPYLWPENWVFSSDTPADVQAKVDAGDPDLQWQTDPQQVVERFAAEVLGWDGIDIGGQESGPGQQFWEFGPACSDPSWCPSVGNEKVSISQPVRSGAGGIWEVQRVAASNLGLSTLSSAPMKSSLEPGAPLAVVNGLGGLPVVAAGTSAANGCIQLGGGPAVGQVATFTVNGVGGSADRAGTCGSLFAAFAYVYAVVDGVPGGYPLTETRPMQALTMLPFVVDAHATPPTSSPVAGTPCTSTPLTNVTIVGQNIALDGCGSWAAGEPIEIKFDVRDDGIPMGLQLFPASACDVNGCSGKPVWTGEIIVGSDMTTYHLTALDAGSYVLLDPVHPVARLGITVG